MGNVVPSTWLAVSLIALGASSASAGGKYGFADQPGGGKNDPAIEIAASIGPNLGAVFSLTEEQANNLYRFNGTASTFQLSTPMPTIPQDSAGANHFIRMKFPMTLSKKIVKSIASTKASFTATSGLKPALTITDETGLHVSGIVVINGRTLDGANVGNLLPTWTDTAGKSLLIGKNILTYVAERPSGSGTDYAARLGEVDAFGTGGATASVREVRIRLSEIDGVTVNGFWVLKIGSGTGTPLTPQTPLTMTTVDPSSPVVPNKFVNSNLVVEPQSVYYVRYSEPVVPLSVGFSADWVKKFNADNPPLPIYFTGNTTTVPNFDLTSLTVPISPNFEVVAAPTGNTSFRVPYNVRPLNPNNLAEYVINPLIDVPAKIDLTVRSLASSANTTATASGTNVNTGVTSLYNLAFDDTTPNNARSFHFNEGRAFVNAPVSPSALYFASVAGTGLGVVNLDGLGYETNDPATSRILFMTNVTQMCACPFGIPGPTGFGCNPNTFGDPNGVSTIGLAGNPTGHLGGPTPIPGVNEGSTGSTANVGIGGSTNPLSIYPEGFETVVKDSEGNARLLRTPIVGSVGDMTIGDFLDKIYYDTKSVQSYTTAAHQSLETIASLGGAFPLSGNSIADPPVPNPPPLRLPVGLPPVDIVYSQQKLFKPAFVMEGDEVWSQFVGCPGATPFTDGTARIALRVNKTNPLQNDLFYPFAQNGPSWQTHSSFNSYGSRQQIGNFLYVSDRDQGVVHVVNSNNFSIVGKIETPDPEGLGLSPDMKRLYVTNYGDDSMSVIDTDPLSPSFHKELTRVNVEGGPIAVAAQPEHEDVFICNYFGNSVSVFDPTTTTIRKTLISTVNKPFDVVSDPRHYLTGFTNAIYFAYIGCQGTGQVVIYESGPTDLGLDDIRWAITSTTTSTIKFPQMRGMIHDMGTFPGSFGTLPGGFYIAHRDPDTGLPVITRVSMTEQKPNPGPLPPLPPPNTALGTPGTFKRTFEIVGTWGGPLQPLSQLNLNGQDLVPYDLSYGDINTKDFFGNFVQYGFTRTNLGNTGTQAGGGNTNSKSPLRLVGAPPAPLPVITADRLYVSFAGDNRIEVIDPQNSGVRLNRIDGVPLPGKLAGFFDM